MKTIPIAAALIIEARISADIIIVCMQLDENQYAPVVKILPNYSICVLVTLVDVCECANVCL